MTIKPHPTTLAPMLVRTTITAPSGDMAAEVIERGDHLLDVMVLRRLREHAPEFVVDEYVWQQVGRDNILTDRWGGRAGAPA